MSQQSTQSDHETVLNQRRIVVAVGGGIAAYKSAELVRRLCADGAEVRVAMTPAATQFITGLTLQALSGHPVHSDLLDHQSEAAMGHIELARWAQGVVVAPATANLMARLATGAASDLVSALCLATRAPVMLAPAMNPAMWAHPATQQNLCQLRNFGYLIMGPACGDTACGEVGQGRMLEADELVGAIAAASETSQAMSGLKVLITAGPTLEDIDPVRYLGNRSSGRMGFALAEAALRAGATVTLVAGPVQLPSVLGVTRIDVRSAEQMRAQVMAHAADCDLFIAAAAVADFRPVSYAEHKIKKGNSQTFRVEMSRNPDILAEVAAMGSGPFTVGFAAETERVVAYAEAKLKTKGADMIAANRVGQADCGFDAECNQLTVLWNGGKEELPMAPKRELAGRLIKLIVERYRAAAA